MTASSDRLWQDWLSWAGENGVKTPGREGFSDARARVWEGSEFVAASCARHPEMLADLLAKGHLDRAYGPGEMNRYLGAVLGGVGDEAALHVALRAFRRREMVRIVWRDLAGLAALDETLEDLSELADVCIAGTLALLREWTQTELGVPRDEEGREQGLVVLGMGKLGARELNLSSDIDLIFAYPASGSVDGPRPLTNEQFFVRLARRLVQALDSQTVDGFVFRVDTRLRPFGDAGPLAMSFGAMEDYYQSQARELSLIHI